MRFGVLFTVAVVMLKSQVSLGQLKFEAGVKAGFNYTNLDLSPVGRAAFVNAYHWKPSFHVGVYGLIKLPKAIGLDKFSIQPEIVLSSQGQRFTTDYNSDLRTSFYYVNVPLIIKYYLIGGLNLQFGPQIGILAGSKGDLHQINNGNIVGPPIQNQPLKAYTNQTDFSLAFGTGIDLPFGGSLTVRYNLGISDTNKFTNASSLPANSIGPISSSIGTSYARNQVLQISFGYRLTKMKK